MAKQRPKAEADLEAAPPPAAEPLQEAAAASVQAPAKKTPDQLRAEEEARVAAIRQDYEKRGVKPPETMYVYLIFRGYSAEEAGKMFDSWEQHEYAVGPDGTIWGEKQPRN